MRNYLICCLVILLFSACKKDPIEFTIKGTVSDETFSQSFSGASVKLYATDAGTVDGNLLLSTTTNSAGEYSFTFERDKYESFDLVFEKSNYFTIESEIPFSDLTTEEDNVFDYSTTAKSWMKFVITNTGSAAATDECKIYKSDGKVNCNECCSQGFSYFYGDIDTTFYCVNDGNTNYGFSYTIVQTGQNSTENFVTDAFDTTEFVISY